MASWTKLAISAIFGAVSGIISVTAWVSDKQHLIEAHGASIERLQATDNVMFDQLSKINQRLSSIEGKLDVILNQKFRDR